MKSYNIAVCLTGEPRTWEHTAEAIKYFFSSDVHNYKFFGHTWNHSFFNKEYTNQKKHPTYVLPDAKDKTNPNHWVDQYDTQTLHSMLTAAFGMTNLLVEDKTVIPAGYSANDLVDPNYVAKFLKEIAANLRKPIVWSHMSYSKMRSNSLKTKYELENDMQFDVVVSARFDVCYPPNSKFDHLLHQCVPILPTALYGESHYFPNEYFLPHVNDIMYFGSSRVMNVVDSFSRYFVSGKFWEMVDESWNDCTLKHCGYNVNLYKWLTIKNILIKTVMQPSIVFRKTAENFKWPQDWDNIADANRNLF